MGSDFEKKLTKTEIGNSLIISFLFMSNIISSIVAISFKIENVYAIFLLILLLFYITINHSLSINKHFLIIITYTLFVFLFSYLMFGSNEYYIQSLLMIIINGCFAGFLVTKKFSYHIISKASIPIVFIISIWLLFNVNIVNGLLIGEKMGFGYSLLPALLLSYHSFRNHVIGYKILSLLNALICLYFIIAFASRGALLCMLIFAAMELIRVYMKTNDLRRVIEISIFVIIIVLIISNLESLLFLFDKLLTNFNIESNTLDRISTYVGNNFKDFDNGRNYIFQLFNNDMNIYSYFIGNGIGEFGVRYNSYTHNLITHLLYEVGILGSLFYFIIICRCVIFLFRNMQNEFLICLFCLSIPRLMVSSYLWQDQFFWMFIVLGLSQIKVSKKREIGSA